LHKESIQYTDKKTAKENPGHCPHKKKGQGWMELRGWGLMGEGFDDKGEPVIGRVMSFNQPLLKISSLRQKGFIFQF